MADCETASLFVYIQTSVYEISAVTYRMRRICLTFKLVAGYIEACIQPADETPFNSGLVSILLPVLLPGLSEMSETAVESAAFKGCCSLM